jgi:hypothetical protein
MSADEQVTNQSSYYLINLTIKMINLTLLLISHPVWPLPGLTLSTAYADAFLTTLHDVLIQHMFLIPPLLNVSNPFFFEIDGGGGTRPHRLFHST